MLGIAMRSPRQFWLVTLLGIGFWLMILAAMVLVFVGYVFCAASFLYSARFFFYGALMLLAGIGLLAGALRHAIVKAKREHSHSARTTSILLGSVVVLLLFPFLFRRRTVPLISNGKVVAIAKRPLLWGDVEYPVYAGNSRLFSLWGDAFDIPWLIYPFADGQRFLCVYDYDISVPVFIVEFGNSATNAVKTAGWPPDYYTRNSLAEAATNIVTTSTGTVRLPTYDELQEVSAHLEKMTPSELKVASFPSFDLGLYRFYVPKDILLKELDVNRRSAWP